MRQNELAPPAGSRHSKKRVGRGESSGHGSFSGRGCKGQKSRSGIKMRPGFEGGQLPIIKRLPTQRGFTNKFRVEYAVVNLEQLNDFPAGTDITAESLVAAGIIKNTRSPLKVLAGGDLDHAITVKANKFSAAAKSKIEAAGGKAEEIS